MSIKIYYIPGLGNDKTIFKDLEPQLPNENICHLEHLEPTHRRESLVEYAKRLKEKIEKEGGIGENAVVIGMSLGGMIAMELRKMLDFKHVFLVSTIKHKKESPFFFRVMRKIPLYRLTVVFMIKKFNKLGTWLLRITNKKGRQHIHEMINRRSNIHFHWGHQAAIHWQNEQEFDNITHIHGTKDEIFKIKKVRSTNIIDKGNHYMVVDRADEIAVIINDKLNELLGEETKALDKTRSQIGN